MTQRWWRHAICITLMALHDIHVAEASLHVHVRGKQVYVYCMSTSLSTHKFCNASKLLEICAYKWQFVTIHQLCKFAFYLRLSVAVYWIVPRVFWSTCTCMYLAALYILCVCMCSCSAGVTWLCLFSFMLSAANSRWVYSFVRCSLKRSRYSANAAVSFVHYIEEQCLDE